MASGRRGSYTEALSFGLLSFVFLAGFGVFGSIVTARLYGVEVIGEFGLVMVPLGLMWTLSTIKEQMALVRVLALMRPREPRATAIYAWVYAFSMGLTTVVGLLMSVAVALIYSGPMNRPELVEPAIALVLSYVLLSNTAWNLQAVMGAFRAGKQLFIVRLGQPFVNLVVAIGLSFYLDSVWGLVIATIAAAGIELLLSLFYARFYLTLHVSRAELRDGRKELPGILRYGIKLAPSTMAEGVSYEVPTFMMGIVGLPLGLLGAFSRAWMLARRFLEANYKVYSALFPTLVERHHNDDHDGFDRAVGDTMRYVVVGMLLLGAVSAGAAEGIMSVFGPGFERGAPALALLMQVPALYAFYGILIVVLQAVDRPFLNTVAAFIRLGVIAALSWPLLKWFGITGAALATLAGYLVTCVYIARVAMPYVSAPWRTLWSPRHILALVIAYASTIGATYLLDQSIGGILGLLLALSAGPVVYVGMFVLCGGLREVDRERVAGVLRRVRPAASAA